MKRRDEEADWEELMGVPRTVASMEDIEVEEALISSQNRKAAGVDNINLDVYKRQTHVSPTNVFIVQCRFRESILCHPLQMIPSLSSVN